MPNRSARPSRTEAQVRVYKRRLRQFEREACADETGLVLCRTIIPLSNMAVYTSTQPLVSKRELRSYANDNAIVLLVALACVLSSKGIGQVISIRFILAAARYSSICLTCDYTLRTYTCRVSHTCSQITGCSFRSCDDCFCVARK